MTEIIDFVKFKKHLNNNNIYLFDSQYRIIHYRLNNINKLIGQVGGSNNTQLNILNIINNMNNITLNQLMISVLDKNIDKTSWMINKYNF